MNANEIMSIISDRVKDTANVHVVFGEPIEAMGVVIIPVASVKVAGGGGGGTGKEKPPQAEEEKTGGGMGLGMQITATPIGYIEVKAGDARFVNVVDMTKIAIGGMLISGLALLTVGRFLGYKNRRSRMLAHKYKQYKHSHQH